MADVLVKLVAAGRLALGGAMVVAPVPAAEAWVGAVGTRPEAGPLARGLGVRDVLLGLGTLGASRRGRVSPAWLWAGALADGVDAVATVAAAREVPKFRRRGLVALAGGVSALQVVLALRAGRARRAERRRS
jgi:hypothetical protein